MKEVGKLCNTLWERFTQSGKISDYLCYVEATRVNDNFKNSGQNRIP